MMQQFANEMNASENAAACRIDELRPLEICVEGLGLNTPIYFNLN